MKCPKCGGEIVWDDSYDLQVSDEECVEFNVGHCEGCDTDFEWERHYKYAYETDPVKA